MKLAPEFLHYALLNVRRLAETSLQIPGICGVRDNYLYATVKGSPQRRERRGPGRSGRDVPTLAGIQRAQGLPCTCAQVVRFDPARGLWVCHGLVGPRVRVRGRSPTPARLVDR